MAIQFNCPYCTATIKVPDSASGKLGRCPKCETRLKVPDIAPPPEAGAPAAPKVSAAGEFSFSAPPQPEPSGEMDFVPLRPGTTPALGDGSALFTLPPANEPAPTISAPPPPTVDPKAARQEYEEGLSWLNRKAIRGAGWPAADRAVQHFSMAAKLDPKNADYAMQAGVACRTSIDRFLESWGTGPLVAIAAFHIQNPLGQAIDKAQQIFRPTGLTAENLALLRARATEGLNWFEKALAVTPEDSVTLCHRAELLKNIGAFGAALKDASRALLSPLATTSARQSAQRITDFVLGEESELRAFLTRSEAQNLGGPPGVELPADKPVAAASPLAGPSTRPALPPTLDEIATFSIRTGAEPVNPALAPTAAEAPLFPSPGGVAVGAPPATYASRLKKKQGGNWLAVAIPVLLLAILLAVAGTYLYINRTQYTGDLAGQDLGNETLRKLISRNQFGVPDDKLHELLVAFRDDPKFLRTDLRTLQLKGDTPGLTVAVRAGENGRLVKVNLRGNAELAAFLTKQAAVLDAPRQVAVAAALKKFVHDFGEAHRSGMAMGNLADFKDTLGGDALVGPLGYSVVGVIGDAKFPCVFEDDEGNVYFLVPRSVERFRVVERKASDEAESVFDAEFGFNVTIAAAPAADPGEPEVPMDSPNDPATAGESPSSDMPAGDASSGDMPAPDSMN